MPNSQRRSRHFPGLDSLRFLAALFVVIGHVPLTQSSVGLPAYAGQTFFYRGSTAVSFFFTLSGFLITYLLLEEHRSTGRISVRRFYLRRVCRIWPLYFLVVLFGLVFYNVLLPALSIDYPVAYRWPVALGLYVFFLPNLVNSLYTVGGILNPSWSIGVEEQFYLTWAPLVRRWRHRLPELCASVLTFFLAVAVLNHYQVFGAGWREKFVGQLQFHYMAAGGLCAYFLHRHRERFLGLVVWRSRWLQWVLLAVLVDFYVTGFLPWSWLAYDLVQPILYCWLIVTVAANPRSVVPQAHPTLESLGKISYGIYMLHMPVVYATSWLFLRTTWWHGRPALYYAAFYLAVVSGTLTLAGLSYRFFELRFLRIKERRFGSGSRRTATPADTRLAPAVVAPTTLAAGPPSGSLAGTDDF